MRQASHHLAIQTPGRGLIDVTVEVDRWLRGQGIESGLLILFCRHTSCSLLIQENADPDVRVDLEAYFQRIAPESGDYVHDAEGPDDMPAHIRTALTSAHLTIPVEGGGMVLGNWQGIYVFEHRTTPHQRDVVLHLIGE